MRTRRAVSGLAAIGILASPALARAHAHLVSSDPAATSVVHMVKAVRITFSEPVVAAFTGAEVAGANGRAVPTGHAAISPSDKRVMIVPLAQPLAPGAYVVRWHAVAADTHRTSGQFGFSVAP
jgi:methionine-rich copper-binding protein CopC